MHRAISHTFPLMLALATLLGASACVEEATEELPLGNERNLHESLLAEDVEALLPGSWIWDHAQPEDIDAEMPALSILFLGHDAVTGDAALLLEEGDDAEQTQRRIQAARVSFSNTRATLHLEDHGYQLEELGEDRLILRDLRSQARLFYLRPQ